MKSFLQLEVNQPHSRS